MEEKSLRKERIGVVVSDKMEKTIVVAAKYKERHPIYGKFVTKTKSTMLMTRRTIVILVIPYVSKRHAP